MDIYSFPIQYREIGLCCAWAHVPALSSLILSPNSESPEGWPGSGSSQVAVVWWGRWGSSDSRVSLFPSVGFLLSNGLIGLSSALKLKLE